MRSLSKFHDSNPYVLRIDGGEEYRVAYVPGESNTGLFGGNSNWRGPVWMPINYLILEALERYHHFYGESMTVPMGGAEVSLRQAADELRSRLAGVFLKDGNGRRACMGQTIVQAGPSDVLFHEYFHAETGRGLGASHQTGWTALVAPMLKDIAQARAKSVPPSGSEITRRHAPAKPAARL